MITLTKYTSIINDCFFFFTDKFNLHGPRKLGFCLNVRVCHSDADCVGAICGPHCVDGGFARICG